MRKSSSPFRDAVLAVVRAIPRGSCLTYKEVAERAGYLGAFRAVGSLLKTNYDPSIPCHRVIRSDGTFGSYNRGDEEKIRILKDEGFRGL